MKYIASDFATVKNRHYEALLGIESKRLAPARRSRAALILISVL
jgi:hypothetical protein